MLQTQIQFTLPRGYVDEQGNLHRDGVMRLATAIDEVEPLQDPRVRSNDAYLPIVLLGRVVLRLGGYSPVPLRVIERLFTPDFTYLQELYLRLNELHGTCLIETQCPTCSTRFRLDPWVG